MNTFIQESLENNNIKIEKLNNKNSLNLHSYYLEDNLLKDSYLQNLTLFVDNIPFYSRSALHDCFATTCQNMSLLKGTVNSMFTKMYFNVPYIKNLHYN
jgi:hypothetical protein